MPLDVLVPGLLPPLDAPPEMRSLRLPALEKWLARADVTRNEARSATQWLAGAFSLSFPAPVAALSLAAEGGPAEGSWIRADPVHVRIDRNKTSLHAGAILDIAQDEADALVAALHDHFRADGLEFRAPAPERWYARVPAGEMPATTPLDEALGRDIEKLLPCTRGRIKWPAALTEIQMILASHEVNARRERDGRPAINSIWLWGGGERPSQVASAYAAVHADDAFARGLAIVAGARVSDAPRTLGDISASVAAESALAMSDAPQRAIHRGNAQEWIDATQRLERDWFEALGETVARFGKVRLVLPAATQTVVATLSPVSRWRLHRRRKPITAYG